VESNQSNDVSSVVTEAKPKSRKTLLIAVTFIVVAGLVISVIFVSALLTNPTTPDQEKWIFKGAFAKYEGSTSVMGFAFDFSAKLEILDFNSTHAYVSTLFNMGSSPGETVDEETSEWVELSNTSFIGAFIHATNVTKSYEAVLNFGDLGTRSCTVYEIATDGPTMTVYVDNRFGWPLKMEISINGEGSLTLSMEIKLVDTNIPALK